MDLWWLVGWWVEAVACWRWWWVGLSETVFVGVCIIGERQRSWLVSSAPPANAIARARSTISSSGAAPGRSRNTTSVAAGIGSGRGASITPV